MSAQDHVTPKTGIPNTTVIYFNGNTQGVGAPSLDTFYACLFFSGNSSSQTSVQHEIPYDAILTNGMIDILTNNGNDPVTFTIVIDGVIPPIENRCVITVPANTIGDIGSVGSTLVKKGEKVSWRISQIDGTNQIQPNHIAIEVFGQ